ncbi:hypothetical protein, partial [Streptococcus danieliae]|uniref:hypothetical protein n=1 Tax=Streptococcus danieliae TaxID=747656 RepID=UPI0021C60979
LPWRFFFLYSSIPLVYLGSETTGMILKQLKGQPVFEGLLWFLEPDKVPILTPQLQRINDKNTVFA